MKVLEWFKKHPLAIVAIVGAVILLFMLGGSRSSAASSGGPSGPSDAEIQANAAITTAQIGASSHAADTSAQVSIAQIQSNAAMYQADKDAALKSVEAQYTRDEQLAGIQGQIQVAEYAAETNKMQIQSQTDQAAIASATYEALARFQADTTQHGQDTTANVELANINAQQNVALAQLNPELEKVKQKESEVQQYYTYKMAGRGSGGGFLGGLIGGIAGVFGL